MKIKSLLVGGICLTTLFAAYSGECRYPTFEIGKQWSVHVGAGTRCAGDGSDVESHETRRVDRDTVVDGRRMFIIDVRSDDPEFVNTERLGYEEAGVIYDGYMSGDEPFLFPVMDFTAEVGELVGETKEWKVLSAAEIEIRGVARKVLQLGVGDRREYWIEGIGRMYDECLLVDLPIHEAPKSHQLEECTLDGGTLFGEDERALILSTMEGDSNDRNGLIRTDRVWEYVMGRRNSDYSYDQVWSRYCFDGTEERYGKDYTRLMRISTTSIYWDGIDGSSYPAQIDETPELVALLREESGKVYMLTPSEKVAVPDYSAPWGSAEKDIASDTEFLLYDFTAEEGDIAEYVTGYSPEWQGGLSLMLTPEKIVDVSAVDAGELGTLKKFTLQNGLYTMRATGKSILTDNGEYDFSMDPATMEAWKNSLMAMCVEGIGNVGYGDLTHVTTEEVLDRPSNGTSYGEWFNNLYDLDGNIIYKGLDMKIPSTDGVTEMEAASPADSPCYDLMGRQISEPLTGTVYIRGGKKYVGR